MMNLMYGIAAIGGMVTFLGSILGLVVFTVERFIKEVKEERNNEFYN